MEKKKPEFMENKLSRLGLLGIFGLLGIGAGVPYLAVFMVFLLFFLFTGVTPDEMFRQHVQKAGLSAFYVYLASTIAVILFALFRVMYQEGTWYDSRTAFSERIGLMGDAFGWIFVITVCVFAFTLMYYTYKEKKALDEQMFTNLREFISESPIWGAILVYFIVNIVFSLVSRVIVISFVSTDAMDGSLYMIMAYMLVTAMAVILAGELFGFSRLGLRHEGLGKGLLWGIPPIAVFCFLDYVSSEPLLFSSLGDIAPLLGNIIFSLLVTTTMAFFSEVLCRGLVLNIMMESWGHSRAGIWRALLFSSTMFSLLVLMNSLLLGWPALLVLGNVICVFSYSMFFGALYLHSGNLWATVIAYASYLGFDLISSFLIVEGYSLSSAFNVVGQPEPGMIIKGVICHALLLIPACLLARGIKPRPPIIIQEPEVNAHAENPA